MAHFAGEVNAPRQGNGKENMKHQSKVGQPGQRALVVATGHGYATKYLLPSAHEAEDLLEEAGYSVSSFFKERAKCAEVYTHLYECKQRGCSPLVAFLVAHGSNEGLREKRRGKVLVDASVCKLMKDAIVFAQSCLRSGSFPETCTRGKDAVRAVVGFQPKLLVPPRKKWWGQFLGREAAENAHAKYNSCILKPLRIVVNGSSEKRATQETALAWDRAATSFLGQDDRVAAVFQANAMTIKLWKGAVATL